VKLEVHAKPRAKKSRIVGWRGPALDVALAAPPVDGAANAELVRLLAEALGIAKRQITVVRGESSRNKLVSVEGLDEADVRTRLDAAAGEGRS
jgi:uncharacterized protein (TIGR00251 family)